MLKLALRFCSARSLAAEDADRWEEGKRYLPDKLHVVLGDVHMYEAHETAARTLLLRSPLKPPKLVVSNERRVDRLEDFTWDDIRVDGYLCHDAIKVEMIE